VVVVRVGRFFCVIIIHGPHRFGHRHSHRACASLHEYWNDRPDATAQAWQANNAGTQSQRAVMLGMLNTIGQCLSILASYLFPSADAPRYRLGTAVNLACSLLAAAACLATSAWLRWENASRDRVEGFGAGRTRRGALNVAEDFDLAVGAFRALFTLSVRFDALMRRLPLRDVAVHVV
jgi:hypothetical protein